MAFEDVATSLGLSPEAIEAIPKDLREDKTLEPIKDFPGLITSHRDAQKMIGSRIAIPKDDDEKGWNELHTKLGRPETPDKYEVVLNKPDVVAWKEDQVAEMKKVFHSIGLNSKQVQKIFDAYGETVVQGNLAAKRAFDECVKSLKNEWGAAYDRNSAIAKRLIAQYGGEEAREFFKADPLGNAPWIARMLAAIAADLDEGGLLEGGETGEIVGAEDARAQIAAIMANAEDLYHARFTGKPGHAERVEEVAKLYAIAYGKI